MRRLWHGAKRKTSGFWERRIYPVLVPFVVIVAVPLSLTGSCWGIQFRLPFFQATTQVFPLLLVALFVELAAAHQSLSRRVQLFPGINNPALEVDPVGKQTAVQARKMVWLTVVGEAASLYAIAAADATVYLGILCVLCMSFTVYLLVTAFLARIAPAELQ
jgi:hypothetical protein